MSDNIERWRGEPVFAVGEAVWVRSGSGKKFGKVAVVVGGGKNPLTELRRAVFGGGGLRGRVKIGRANMIVRDGVSYIIETKGSRGGAEYSWPKLGNLEKA